MKNFVVILGIVINTLLFTASLGSFFAGVISFILPLNISYIIAISVFGSYFFTNLIRMHSNGLYEDAVRRRDYSTSAGLFLILLGCIIPVYMMFYCLIEAYGTLNNYNMTEKAHVILSVIYTLTYFRIVSGDWSVSNTIKNMITAWYSNTLPY